MFQIPDKCQKQKIFIWKKSSKYRNTVLYDCQSRFVVIFSNNYRHRLVMKIPFLDFIFPKISKYRNENLYFPSTGKYYVSPPPSSAITWSKDELLTFIEGYQCLCKSCAFSLQYDVCCHCYFRAYTRRGEPDL